MDLFDEVDRPLPFQLPNSDEYSYEWVESSRLLRFLSLAVLSHSAAIFYQKH